MAVVVLSPLLLHMVVAEVGQHLLMVAVVAQCILLVVVEALLVQHIAVVANVFFIVFVEVNFLLTSFFVF
jgi:hypothetical protein